MHDRYINLEIEKIWSDEQKLLRWQEVELAALRARLKLGESGLTEEIVSGIETKLRATTIDLVWWKDRDKEVKHDLNAFLDERRRHLTSEQAIWWHKGLTSYDTEEAPFAIALRDSVALAEEAADDLEQTLIAQAIKYRYTLMNERTHGQEAEVQSFGRRCLSWLVEVRVARQHLAQIKWVFGVSKLSGATGNYGDLDPKLEQAALDILGFKPMVGVTQIMPRSLYGQLAAALHALVAVLAKIAGDLRLGARSGWPLWQEPFGKKQMGSSAMPHKKNTITWEQLEGMERLAHGYLNMILDNIQTWEGRAIEQSCVERVAWPDLFHVLLNSLIKLNSSLAGLAVYPDNMLREIVRSRGCYASANAKDLLKELGELFGLSAAEAYRIVQLAAFIAHEPMTEDQELRSNPPKSLEEAQGSLNRYRFNSDTSMWCRSGMTLKTIIKEAQLTVCSQLAADQDTVRRWNDILRQIFSTWTDTYKADVACDRWEEIFSVEYLLRHEGFVFKEVLGVN